MNVDQCYFLYLQQIKERTYVNDAMMVKLKTHKSIKKP